eukprot:TRINITY_DN50895_c0_g1_i1.p3 TRINITY_DN50895_c0_g1~~TRINITY_DN50895_c0_g1_i1.p3  ORF type:complete len:215 (+),score=73.30 TRINITY_DN50895_c0_g1_i1:78-722(+)
MSGAAAQGGAAKEAGWFASFWHSWTCLFTGVACGIGAGGAAAYCCTQKRKEPFGKAKERLRHCAGVGAADCARAVEVYCYECREAYCGQCLQPAHARSAHLRRHCDFVDLKAPESWALRRRSDTGRTPVQHARGAGRPAAAPGAAAAAGVASPVAGRAAEALSREEYAELVSLLQSDHDQSEAGSTTFCDDSTQAANSSLQHPPRSAASPVSQG